ncbi:BTB/POZ domain-containing protein SR1IP1-like [Arachis stenosperma]|uniref:BTB/POZ domain-containing protein SR1IP1-like n=1 Tax=Arachis stenosperma TaxID=217475 RepID=UPI0025ABF59D|nr:BTB/POZ domain-containing protein SR1IP1-like [Arachis stenosperma]
MIDCDKEKTAAGNLFSNKKGLTFSNMRRTSEWIFSHELPSDITVQVGEDCFLLHKFPLVTKCGYIRKLVSQSSEVDASFIEINDVPGGADAFELAAKFCYGINFEISIENIAILHCVAEYLEMTEDISIGNLASRTESYLNEVALETIPGAVTVLSVSETLFPAAEKAKLVSQCVDAIAYIACKESQFCSSAKSDGGSNDWVMSSSMDSRLRPVVEWWAEDLTVLRIDIFQRVLLAMLARGFKHHAIGPILMLYAQKSLRGLEIFGKGWKKIDEPTDEQEKRIVVETIVNLLPNEKNAMSVSFLAMLLRASIYIGTTVSCRLDLERRMALQLDQAVLDDLLIPSYSYSSDTLFDVDTVQRIMVNYLESEMTGDCSIYNGDDEYFLPSRPYLGHVGKLMEGYLAEVASDKNLLVSKFISLAELIPDQERTAEDGMYRAIDIYLKAHPTLSEMERKKICSLMDCQKLSRDACAHAAQNNRLPVQTVVQVLYHEQQRLRETSEEWDRSSDSIIIPTTSNEASNLRRENEELRVEVAKLKMKLKEIQKFALVSASGSSSATNSSASPCFSEKPPLQRKSFMSSVSKKLGRLSPLFQRADYNYAATIPSETKVDKNRRHSIS